MGKGLDRATSAERAVRKRIKVREASKRTIVQQGGFPLLRQLYFATLLVLFGAVVLLWAGHFSDPNALGLDEVIVSTALILAGLVPLALLRPFRRWISGKSGGLIFEPGKVRLGGKTFDLRTCAFQTEFAYYGGASGRGTIVGHTMHVHSMPTAATLAATSNILLVCDNSKPVRTMLLAGRSAESQKAAIKLLTDIADRYRRT